jgi:hypothetical protein
MTVLLQSIQILEHATQHDFDMDQHPTMTVTDGKPFAVTRNMLLRIWVCMLEKAI